MAEAPSGNEAKKFYLASHTKTNQKPNMIKFKKNNSGTSRNVTLWPSHIVNFEHIKQINTLFNIDMCRS